MLGPRKSAGKFGLEDVNQWKEGEGCSLTDLKASGCGTSWP